jgi:hypothetical protein
MASRLIDRTKKSGKLGGSPGQPAADFGSDGVSEGSLTAAQIGQVLLRYPTISEVGQPGLDEVEGTAGNASATITVPSGKYWRLIGLYHTLVTDANVANRAVVILTRTTADATIDTITHANVAASTTAKRVTLFGQDDYVRGDRAVAAQGTLSMATKPTATNTMTINGVAFTWVAALTGAVNELLIGADAAASQAAANAAFVSANRATASGLHSVSDAVFASLECTAIDFAANDMVFTANVKGTAGNSIATTETFTAGGNVFDAATLGTTTAGLDAGDKVSSTLDYPDAGNLLGPGEDLNISVTNGVAGDSLDTYLFYLEFDADPTP